jgi:hypothetical protein
MRSQRARDRLSVVLALWRTRFDESREMLADADTASRDVVRVLARALPTRIYTEMRQLAMLAKPYADAVVAAE